MLVYSKTLNYKIHKFLIRIIIIISKKRDLIMIIEEIDLNLPQSRVYLVTYIFYFDKIVQ